MRILFIHNNFPGQYRRLVNRLRGDKNYELLSASLASNDQPAPFTRVGYMPHRQVRDDIHPALKYTEGTVITGQAAVQALLPLKKQGYRPDIVLSHSGWGPSLFIKDLWPDVRHLSYFEWYYDADGGESGFLDGKPLDLDARLRLRMKNTALLHDLASMDWGQVPTQYQASQFPSIFRERMTVLHDGVDTEFFSPAENATVTIGSQVFRKGDPIVTYISRGMEAMRGFPQFVEAIYRLQQTHSSVHTFIIGEDKIAYGKRKPDNTGLKSEMLEKFPLDAERTHWLGRQPLTKLRDVLRISAAHVYLTVPFVLSWSMLEAMSTGALIVGSATPPVMEVVKDGENGLLCDFFDTAALAARIEEAIGAPQKFESLRVAARKTILDRYEVGEMTSRYVSLIHSVAAGEMVRKLESTGKVQSMTG